MGDTEVAGQGGDPSGERQKARRPSAEASRNAGMAESANGRERPSRSSESSESSGAFLVVLLLALAVLAGLLDLLTFPSSLLGPTEVLLIAAVALVVLVLVLFRSSYLVQPFEVAYALRGTGPGARRLDPGWSLVSPFSKVYRVDRRTQVLEVETKLGITKDKVPVRVRASLRFKVDRGAFAALGVPDYREATVRATEGALLLLLGTKDLAEIEAERPALNSALAERVSKDAAGWGVRVSAVELLEVDPGPSVLQAMSVEAAALRQHRAELLRVEDERQNRLLQALEVEETAARQRRAEILRADGQRRSHLLLSEGEMRSRLLQAEGERLAGLLEAIGHAQRLQLRAASADSPSSEIYRLLGPDPENTMALRQANLTLLPRRVSMLHEEFSRPLVPLEEPFLFDTTSGEYPDLSEPTGEEAAPVPGEGTALGDLLPSPSPTMEGAATPASGLAAAPAANAAPAVAGLAPGASISSKVLTTDGVTVNYYLGGAGGPGEGEPPVPSKSPPPNLPPIIIPGGFSGQSNTKIISTDKVTLNYGMGGKGPGGEPEEAHPGPQRACVRCGVLNPANYRFCVHCGAPPPPDVVHEPVGVPMPLPPPPVWILARPPTASPLDWEKLSPSRQRRLRDVVGHLHQASAMALVWTALGFIPLTFSVIGLLSPMGGCGSILGLLGCATAGTAGYLEQWVLLLAYSLGWITVNAAIFVRTPSWISNTEALYLPFVKEQVTVWGVLSFLFGLVASAFLLRVRMDLTPLISSCPHCYTTNPPTQQYCRKCGRQVFHVAPARSARPDLPPYPASGRAGGERRPWGRTSRVAAGLLIGLVVLLGVLAVVPLNNQGQTVSLLCGGATAATGAVYLPSQAQVQLHWTVGGQNGTVHLHVYDGPVQSADLVYSGTGSSGTVQFGSNGGTYLLTCSTISGAWTDPVNVSTEYPTPIL